MNTLNTTLHGVSIAILHFGLLRTNDVENLKVGDVVLSQEKKMILVTFNHQRKLSEGCSHNILTIALFEYYIDQLCKETIPNEKLQYLKKLEYEREKTHAKHRKAND